MTAKEYLGQAYRLDQRINSKIEQVASLNELATKCTSSLTGMPRNPNRATSTMADAVAKIIDLQAEINRDGICASSLGSRSPWTWATTCAISTNCITVPY